MSEEVVRAGIAFSLICVTISAVILLGEIVWWKFKLQEELRNLRNDKLELQEKCDELKQTNDRLSLSLCDIELHKIIHRIPVKLDEMDSNISSLLTEQIKLAERVHVERDRQTYMPNLAILSAYVDALSENRKLREEKENIMDRDNFLSSISLEENPHFAEAPEAVELFHLDGSADKAE